MGIRIGFASVPRRLPRPSGSVRDVLSNRPGKQGYVLATIATLLASIDQQLASIDQQLNEQGDSLAAIVNIARVDRQQLASIDE
jgi:hypothetical protein